jgi:demethylmenaquinone methyltransferase/2-methoxy-6-polyprenyl-1,4-benzoquinol methylase
MVKKQQFKFQWNSTQRSEYVQKMFSEISGTYDLINDLFTFGMHKKWKRKLAQSFINHNDIVVDIGCGTGDFSFACMEQKPQHVIGIDFSSEMIQEASKKNTVESQKCIKFVIGDAVNLPIRSSSVDICSLSFVIRNIPNIQDMLSEVHRILKPGGKLVILEVFKPPSKGINFIVSFYINFFVLFLGRVISKHKDGYVYLNYSINTFMNIDELGTQLQQEKFIIIQKKMVMLASVGTLVVQKGD